MHRSVRLTTVAILITLAFAAQGAPMHADLAGLDGVPHYAVEGEAAAQALLLRPQARGEPLRFAAGVPLQLTIADGRWDTVDATTSEWRLRIGSRGARLLNFALSKLQLPPSAALAVYDAEGKVVQGPYTAASADSEGRLWTAVVPGEEAVLEVRVANAERDQVQLQIDTAFHAMHSLGEAAAESGSLSGNSAASCEVDVACPAGNGWSNQISATAVYTVQDTSSSEIICTGELMNNTRQDDTPYFLTAHHCQVGWSLPASSVVVYWNFQNSSCDPVISNGNLNDNQSGATFVATDAPSDFDLLRLNANPPAAFKVFYAGWDIGSAAPTSGVGIHHPQGDVKKISTYSTSAVDMDVQLETTPPETVHAWQITWTSGITEDGSSGSGLWNQSGRMVGVLSGGNTACAVLGGAPTGNDFYGRLNAAWTASNAASGQLKAWLDPCNSGATQLDGKSPGAINSCTSGGSSSGGSSSSSSSGGTTGSSSGGGTGGFSGGGGAAGGLLWLTPALFLTRRRARPDRAKRSA